MTSGSHRALAQAARVSYLESLIKGSGALVQACLAGARLLASQTAEPALHLRRRDVVLDLPAALGPWHAHLDRRLTEALRDLRVGRPLRLRPLSQAAVDIPLGLVEDADVERDLVVSRLSQAVSDLTGSEFTDLNARLQAVGGAVEPQSPQADVLQAQAVARWVLESWREAGLSEMHWHTLQTVAQNEVSHWVHEALHQANQALLDQGVRPEIDLRPFIRRSRPSSVGATPSQFGPLGSGPGHSGWAALPGAGNSGLQPMGRPFEETHLVTQTPDMQRGAAWPQAAQMVLGKLNQVVARQVPQFEPTALQGPAPARTVHVSEGLGVAMQQVQSAHGRLQADGGGAHFESPALALQALQQHKQTLKQATNSPIERATIEIVALLFQAILMEERLPASIRVWFARLQMPVLRVAVSEPDFFASTTHPARALIDRMGSCVMGFVAHSPAEDDALHGEIKRIVQVVEAYPDTGRRVFQTVLTEFERFLETYFREDNAASRKGVSLAQQVELRETWAIQYTIELRKMLEGMPVHEGVREFLFHVWADVLAHSALQTSQSSDETRLLKRAAADLIWSASAKVSREERADVLRRLPPLLKLVREGMARAGLSAERQDAHIQSLNTALAAAFSARSAPLSAAHLQAVTERLAALDEVLPDVGEIEIDEQMLRDISGHERDDLEVVADGGTMPTPAMLAWARELKVGAWFQLDYRGRQESVQLAWLGMQRQLILFVSPSGRGILFQLRRLAAFLQSGLLLPLEEESLTTRATREALARLDADPDRLLR